jgi:multidrug transporter EmrE-like cation transporter
MYLGLTDDQNTVAKPNLKQVSILQSAVKNLASNIVVTVSGVLVFQEPVHGLRWVAIAMSLFAIGLFAYTGASSKQ